MARTGRFRPAPGGVSIGHHAITAGTLGAVVYDREAGTRLILSNNHVLANSNDAQLGDAIIQPGAADGGKVEGDRIASLFDWVPIEFGPGGLPDCPIASGVAGWLNRLARIVGSRHRLEAVKIAQSPNRVDAAVAIPDTDADLLGHVLGIGPLVGALGPVPGNPVRKSGRTTELTTGTIEAVGVTVNVQFGAGRIATFEDQFVTGPMSQPGDSGSVVVDGDTPHAVGLLFAGSDQVTICNPIGAVLDELDLVIGADESAPVPGSWSLRDHRDALLDRENVVGAGVGRVKVGGRPTGDLGYVVLVERKVPLDQLAPEDRIPRTIDDVRVDVQEVGRIVAQ